LRALGARLLSLVALLLLSPLAAPAAAQAAGPEVVTEPASSLTQTSATLNASVNPKGEEVSECKFEYGTTTEYGQTAPCSAPPGSGSTPVAVSASVTGLTANTVYHFRISATDPGGTNKGLDQTFMATAPTVVTEPASSLTQTSATLNATVNPNGGEVSECKFEYGTTTEYGQTAPCSAPPGSGSSPVAVSASVTGLTANTAYHFRISAKNTVGPSVGADQSFTTLAVTTSPQQGPASQGTTPAQAVLSSQEHSAGGGAKAAGAPAVISAQTGANSVTLTVACRGTSSQTCDGDASLYGTEHRLASRIVSLSRKRPRTVVVLVGHLHFTLHAGQTLALTLRLNPTGRTLLRRFGRLPVKLVVRLNKANGGKLIVIGKGTIEPPHKHKRRH
jgi:hypothetical protein